MNDRPVIYWCLGEAGPEGAGLTIPEIQTSLSAEERSRYETLRFPKRRDEWTLGRITAKRLLRACIPELANVELSRLTIANQPTGAPYATLDGNPMALQLSISHRQGTAAAAVTAHPGISLGIDLEWVEERDASFYFDFFTPVELSWMKGCPANQIGLIGTVIWSAKESMLKALGQGLRLDTRSVEILRIANNVSEDWSELEIQAPNITSAKWLGFWRKFGGSICTIAVKDPQDEPELRQINM